MPVAVKNNRRGPLVLTRGKDDEWVFGGNGSADGTDTQMLPDDIKNDPNFLRMTRKGLLMEVPMDDAIAALDRQAESWAQEQSNYAQQVAGVIDRSSDRDMVVAADPSTGLVDPNATPQQVQGSRSRDMVFPVPGGVVDYIDTQAAPPAAPASDPNDFRNLVQQAAQEEPHP